MYINKNYCKNIIIDNLEKENVNETTTLLSIITNYCQLGFLSRKKDCLGSNSSLRKALTILFVGTNK